MQTLHTCYLAMGTWYSTYFSLYVQKGNINSPVLPLPRIHPSIQADGIWCFIIIFPLFLTLPDIRTHDAILVKGTHTHTSPLIPTLRHRVQSPSIVQTNSPMRTRFNPLLQASLASQSFLGPDQWEPQEHTLSASYRTSHWLRQEEEAGRGFLYMNWLVDFTVIMGVHRWQEELVTNCCLSPLVFLFSEFSCHPYMIEHIPQDQWYPVVLLNNHVREGDTLSL